MKCPHCGEGELYFKGRISTGYSEFCSTSCQLSYRNLHPEEYLNFDKIDYAYKSIYEVPHEIYKVEDLLKSNEGRNQWLIPKELCLFPNSVLDSSTDRYVDYINLPRYLRSIGLSLFGEPISTQEYYDVFILNLTSKSDRPKCELPGCSEEVEFINVSHGYRRCCCRSHDAYLRYIKGDHNFIHINNLGGTWEYMRSNPEFYEAQLSSYKDFNSNGGAAARMRDRFNHRELYEYHCSISEGTALARYSKLSEIYFYIIWDKSNIKIGITQGYMAKYRIVQNSHLFDEPSVLVFKGDPVKLIELEKSIKLKYYLNSYGYLNSSVETEIFEAKIVDEIKEYLFTLDFLTLEG